MVKNAAEKGSSLDKHFLNIKIITDLRVTSLSLIYLKRTDKLTKHIPAVQDNCFSSTYSTDVWC